MYKLVLIGTGYWGKKIYKSIYSQHCQFIGYVNNGNSTIEELPRMTLEEACNSDADIFVIATPIDTLSFYAKAGLLNGKHLFLEKPGGQSLNDLKELSAIANKKNLKVIVGYKFVYDLRSPRFVGILPKEKDIIFSVVSKIGSFNNDLCLNLISHQISIAKFLYGNINDFFIKANDKDSMSGVINRNFHFHVNRNGSKTKICELVVIKDNYDYLEHKHRTMVLQYESDDSLMIAREFVDLFNSINFNQQPFCNLDFAIDVMKVIENNILL